VLVLFDVLAHGGEITTGHSDPFLALLFYSYLRLPALLVLITPLGVLLGSIMTFSKLAEHQEIVAMEATGFTLYRIVAILGVGVFFFALLQFIFTEQFGTQSATRLREWEANGYTGLPKAAMEDPIPRWIAMEDFIVSLEDASPDGRILYDTTFIQLAEDGGMSHYYRADRARYDGRYWVLDNVYSHDLMTDERERTHEVTIALSLSADQFAPLNRPVDSLHLFELRAIAKGHIPTQIFPGVYYEIYYLRRLIQPLGVLVMLLLAAPVALQLNRSGHRFLFIAFSLAGGFLFLILEYIFLSLGENQTLPPLFAASGAHTHYYNPSRG